MKVFDEKGITHLDLHGVRHLEASDEVIDFVYQYQSELPLTVSYTHLTLPTNREV